MNKQSSIKKFGSLAAKAGKALANTGITVLGVDVTPNSIFTASSKAGEKAGEFIGNKLADRKEAVDRSKLAELLMGNLLSADVSDGDIVLFVRTFRNLVGLDESSTEDHSKQVVADAQTDLVN